MTFGIVLSVCLLEKNLFLLSLLPAGTKATSQHHGEGLVLGILGNKVKFFFQIQTKTVQAIAIVHSLFLLLLLGPWARDTKLPAPHHYQLKKTGSFCLFVCLLSSVEVFSSFFFLYFLNLVLAIRRNFTFMP